MRRLVVLCALLAACVTLAASQGAVGDRYDRAYQAWDNGDYINALEGFASILEGPESAQYFDRIALVTGELYQVTEITPDGRSARFSRSGRYAAYETGPRTAPLTRIVDLQDALRVIAEIRGLYLSFSPSRDAVVYLKTRDTPDVLKVRQELERLLAQPVPDRAALIWQQRRLTELDARDSEFVIRDLPSGQEQRLEADGLLKAMPRFSADGRQVYFAGAKESDTAANEIFVVSDSSKPRAVTTAPAFKTDPLVVPGGRYLVYQIAAQSPFAGGGQPGGRGGGAGAARQFAVLDLTDGRTTAYTGGAPALSADGSAMVFLARSGTDYHVQLIRFATSLEATTVKKSPDPITAPALAPDGSRVTYSMLYNRNQEVFCLKSDGTGEVRVTREIQHDTSPRFLTNSTLVAIKGESRHSRSYLYDLDTLTGFRLFHNNTIRTIAPEYEWAADRTGTRLLIVAERDGDTISPERGVYLVDLTRKVTSADLLARIQANLDSERRLRATGEAMFRPIAEKVRSIVSKVSITKIYGYEETLFNFDSKYITNPGNKPAGDYIYSTFKSFGYEPEYQWFTQRETKTANILATLRGTENPDLIYVLSSHYDSNLRSPGGDDNDSATAVLLETARVLAGTPMPATIVFAAFTGEEAGLLGSREFVRQAVEKKLKLAGALNNDMIGWTNDHRLDNTIRYSNAGIRDLQHAASFLFSRMITYDARYFKATDAAAYYDAYGDVVGGFGSYPVLGNPYYHQPTDLLETVNHQLLVEATKANVASIMGLASSPARLQGLKATLTPAGHVEISWAPSPEKGVVAYTVAYGPPATPLARILTVKQPSATLAGVQVTDGQPLQIAVRAVTARGMAGWDWARASVTK